MAIQELIEYKAIRIKDAGFNEAWLQNIIADNPSVLGLGDLRLVAKERIVSSGGRLDILLQDSNEEKMYEVEVQLGDTDPSHIIRTIEYWDLIRKRYPQRQHYAVIVAEGITKRYFNVLNVLSANVPIIAIKSQIIQIDGKSSLVFTEILDSYEEPEEISLESNKSVDEKYWETNSSKILKLSKDIFEAIKPKYENISIEYNNWSIVIKSYGYNQIKINKRSNDSVMLELKYGKNKNKIFELLENNQIQFDDKYNQVRFTIKIDLAREKMEMISTLTELNKEWWRNDNEA